MNQTSTATTLIKEHTVTSSIRLESAIEKAIDTMKLLNQKSIVVNYDVQMCWEEALIEIIRFYQLLNWNVSVQPGKLILN
jgi:hypothetical protein